MAKIKCFVKPCPNHTHQGNFTNSVCNSCLKLAKDIQNETLNGNYFFEEGVLQFITDNWREVIKESEDSLDKPKKSYEIITRENDKGRIREHVLYNINYIFNGKVFVRFEKGNKNTPEAITTIYFEDSLFNKVIDIPEYRCSSDCKKEFNKRNKILIKFHRGWYGKHYYE